MILVNNQEFKKKKSIFFSFSTKKVNLLQLFSSGMIHNRTYCIKVFQDFINTKPINGCYLEDIGIYPGMFKK